MRVIGVTGGVATGKTTFCEYIKELGYKVIDLDEIAHQLFDDEEFIHEVLAEFGKKITSSINKIDKEKLREVIFSDIDSRERLNSLSHPRLFAKLLTLIYNCEDSVLFIDAPLLFETELFAMVDDVILIDSRQDLQILRLKYKYGICEDVAKLYINAQWPLCIKRRLTKNIICNNSTIQDLKEQVDKKIIFFLSEGDCF